METKLMKKLLYLACLFWILMGSIHAYGQAVPAPQMIFVNKDSVYDFGGIPAGMSVTYKFEIRNTGDAPLTISGMSCPLPNVQFNWPAKEIKPRKRGYLSV